VSVRMFRILIKFDILGLLYKLPGGLVRVILCNEMGSAYSTHGRE